jgi:hypothetical protein
MTAVKMVFPLPISMVYLVVKAPIGHAALAQKPKILNQYKQIRFRLRSFSL